MRLQRSQIGMGLLVLALSGIGCTSFREAGSFDGEFEGPKRWTNEWYAQEACQPEGSRQLQSHGRAWPPYPRPAGKGQQWSHRFHASHYWPHPYNCQDIAYLRAVSATQVNNGWVQETTLFGYHFGEDHTLNHAGRLHLKWIAQTIPEERRYVWVQAADDKETSNKRLEHVKKAAAEFGGDGNTLPVALRFAPMNGRPTAEINDIRTLETNSRRAPIIPYASPSGGSGGGSSGGGTGSGGGAASP